MKILHLSNHCVFGNGNVHAAVDLACSQVVAGHEVYFASAGGDFEGLLRDHGVQHIYLRQEHKRPLRAVVAIGRLVGLIRRLDIDVVHAHMMTGAILGYFASRLTSRPLVTTVHNSFDRHSIIMGLADRVIAVSNAVAENMIGRGVNPNKVFTVLNGTLNVARRLNKSDTTAELSRPSITTVCGLHSRKGVNFLIDAFDIVSQHNTDVNLTIIGEGPEEGVYREQASRSKHPDRIHFLGQKRDVDTFLRASDIFVLASLQDPCPLVIPEAREAGCAIVATRVDGIPEMLAIGEAGIMVPASDASALADALASLLDNPALLAEQKQRSLVGLDYFDIRRVCHDTDRVYRDALVIRRRRN